MIIMMIIMITINQNCTQVLELFEVFHIVFPFTFII